MSFVHRALAFCCVLSLLACAPADDSPIADWHTDEGVFGAPNLRIHFSYAGENVVGGKLDDRGMGTRGLPLEILEATDDKLTFAAPTLAGLYESSWNADDNIWNGYWSRYGNVVPVDLLPGPPPPAPVIAGLDGEWSGIVKYETGNEVRLTFRIATGAEGTVGSLFASDDESAIVYVSGIRCEGERITFRVPTWFGQYEGTISPDGKAITGEWIQGRSLPLVLARGDAITEAASILRSVAMPPVDLPPRVVREDATPSDAEITEMLRRRIDVEHEGIGIVVGLIEPARRRVISYGKFSQDDPRVPDGDTVFEIASVTKVFTALLLAEMAERGEVGLNDSVAKYLPPQVTVPSYNGRQITLVDLATHTSGLPRKPDNLVWTDPINEFVGYTVDDLYEFLDGFELDHEIGTTYEYSDLGMGLLGHALALRADADYETLLRERILLPLGMTSTAIDLSPELTARLAPGHNGALEPTKSLVLPVIPGAYALRSTAEDLLNFLAAELGYEPSPLSGAMARQLAVRRPTRIERFNLALGWQISSGLRGDIVAHDGSSNGYRSFLAFDPERRIGVVVLSNAGTRGGVVDIGYHILDPLRPVLLTPTQ